MKIIWKSRLDEYAKLKVGDEVMHIPINNRDERKLGVITKVSINRHNQHFFDIKVGETLYDNLFPAKEYLDYNPDGNVMLKWLYDEYVSNGEKI